MLHRFFDFCRNGKWGRRLKRGKQETEEREAGASGAFLRSETEEIRERANLTTDAEALRGMGRED